MPRMRSFRCRRWTRSSLVLVVQTLARCDGNRTRAARMLGLSVRTLRNKVRLYSAEGIEVPMHLK